MRYFLGCLLLGIGLFAFRPGRDFKLEGQLQDATNGSAIAGATVSVKGTPVSTTTGTDGGFLISIPSEHATLVFNAAGYDKKELTVKNDLKPLIVKLNRSVTQLDEVVVTGYGIPGTSAGLWVRKSPGKNAIDKRKNGFHEKDDESFNREGYDGIVENRFLLATDNPLSTFSIDVDGASYSNVRRFLQSGQLPPAGAVRIEELINYFHYDYPQPKDNEPFSINTEIADCPWNTQNKLVMVGLQGKKIPMENLPASNLVFLIDVSGSMMQPDKLPLVKSSLKLLVDQLREQDFVSLVVYAGNAGLVMPSTSGDQKQSIKDAIDRLEAGGSTAGGAGIRLAYKVARDHFIKEANNRVILCTDGDFNVGASSDAALEQMIEEERKSGVYLTVLGYGTGNYQDSKMQKLADKGNGNHAYIDNIGEAKKVLVNEFGGTLFTIAKDVKLQVEFNPAKVQAYRLVGYENRMLNKEDFNNDKKDAGDLGSGHTVTALYEIIPVGVKSNFIEKVDPLKYQQQNKIAANRNGEEMMTIKFRYKKPGEDASKLIEHPVIDQRLAFNKTSENFRFVASVAQFGMLLRNSEFKEQASFERAIGLAKNALGTDHEGYRAEFLQLLKKAGALTRKDGIEEQDQEDIGSR
ncbi:MAG TPA: von Willebrand factor type A domain-containing protein [Puia sp.]|nr:von Willebrand factor type A domain-containing protein [Puia sp.]